MSENTNVFGILGAKEKSASHINMSAGAGDQAVPVRPETPATGGIFNGGNGKLESETGDENECGRPHPSARRNPKD